MPPYKTARDVCIANGTSCLAFNTPNCYLKSGFDKLEITTLADLLVKQLPAGQFKLRANPALCLEVGTEAIPVTSLQPCNPALPRQLWTVETSTSDGSFLCGPVTSAADGRVLDVYYSGESIDTAINVYGWGATPNQVWNYDAYTGLIRATQLGVCAGACAFF